MSVASRDAQPRISHQICLQLAGRARPGRLSPSPLWLAYALWRALASRLARALRSRESAATPTAHMAVVECDGFVDDLPLRQVEFLGDLGAAINRHLRDADGELRVL
jgi:hypothetical protein